MIGLHLENQNQSKAAEALSSCPKVFVATLLVYSTQGLLVAKCFDNFTALVWTMWCVSECQAHAASTLPAAKQTGKQTV